VTNERRQFRVLLRSFLSQVVDVDLISPGGEMQTLGIQFAALLAAFNFVVAIVIVPRYGISPLPHATLMTNAWSDEEFLINTSISVAGLFMVLAWDTFLPDLRDRLVLGVLPVRLRTIALAKAAAVGCALGLSVLLVNIFTGFCYAMILAVPGGGLLGLLRAFCAYWITMAAATLFVACLLLSVQGLTAQLLPHRMFVRVSNFIQLGTFFTILAVYFLKPPLATPAGLTSPHNRLWLAWPSYWFLGLFQQLNGPMHPVFKELAGRAIWALLASSLLAAVTLTLGYLRSMRRMAEQSDIFSADRSRRAAHFSAIIAKWFFKVSLDRAIFMFTARTLARSRKHRLLLAMFGGVGLAIALAYMESLLNGGWKQTWNQPNAPLLVASLVVLLFSIVGTRVVFTFPLALRSNWIFRVSAVHSPQSYFAAIRKSLYALTVFPICIASAIFFFAIWPGRSALQHLLVLMLAGVLILERSLYGFRKIPFTCSYLPGKANLKVTLTMYGSLILFAAHQGGQLEFWAMQRPARYLVVILLLAGAAVWTRRRLNQSAAAPFTPIQFEDLPPGEMVRLDILAAADSSAANPM
jgi:hypothetical protein